MARFKPIHKGLKLLPVDFDRQVIPGSFEYALCYLVDHELDLSAFHARYKNDVEGASAFDPAVLIKIILLAYSRGIIHSRKIEAACRENVLFIAVSGDSQPHFTTLAAFVSNMGDMVAKLFAQVLLVCDRQGLIGREMFAIDGVKLPANRHGASSTPKYESSCAMSVPSPHPSPEKGEGEYESLRDFSANASKAKSGSRADYRRLADRMELAARKMLEKHQSADAAPTDNEIAKAARAASVYPISPIMNRPKWRPAKA